ncbi:MAG: CHAP domain-containing protein [Oscillospiraceae bacterium]|nr:CHAP domain-containing protein [Oscillospiraceae bacterium]
MRGIIEQVQNADAQYEQWHRVTNEKMIGFIHSIQMLIDSIGKDFTLAVSELAGMNANFNPQTGLGGIPSQNPQNILAQEARWIAMGVAGIDHLWQQAILAQNPNHQPLRTEYLNSIVAGNQVPRESVYFRNATYNTFLANIGQCTWFAEGRAREITGHAIQWDVQAGRNAVNWANPGRIQNGTLSNIPSQGAIMVWGSGGIYGSAGHVAVVERIVHTDEGFSVLWSHANVTGSNVDDTENSTSDGRIDSLTRSQLDEQSDREIGEGKFLGFIHLQ